MNLIRSILSHFQKNKAKNKAPITINGVTIQQINNTVQQNNDTAEPNNEEFNDLELPPPKKLKKEVIELKNDDIPENSNISEARVSFDDEQTAVSKNNIGIFTVFDLTGNLEEHNALEVDETAENRHISKSDQTAVNNNLTDNPNSLEVHNVSESETADNNKIPKTKVSSDKQIVMSVNNENITFKNDIDNDLTSKDIPYDDKETAISLNVNNNIIDETGRNSKNILKTGETTADGKQTIVSINNNVNLTTIDNTDNSNCNKLHNLRKKPKIVTNILIKNKELALINDNTEETTTECIREFEDILANVENELSLDTEINVDDVNDLINDLRFDSDDEFQIFDTESQIPKHIIRKHIEKQISADVIDFSYDITVESVEPNKTIEFSVEIKTSITERDTKIKTTANIGNTTVTDVTNDTSTDVNNSDNEKGGKINTIKIIANDGNTKPDIINTNNGNIKENTTKIEDCDIISLSSDDNIIYISDSSDSDCGYHSSDFEFITEEEAKREGLIINSPSNLKSKEVNAKSNSRRRKIKKTSLKGKKVQVEQSKTHKLPTNGKNTQADPRKSLRKFSNGVTIQPGPSWYLGTALNVQADPSNCVQMPSNIRARPSKLVQMPFNTQAGPSNLVQMPFNIQAEPRNCFKRPSYIQTGPKHSVQKPFKTQAGPSNPVQMPSNVQVGPSNPVQMPSNVQAGPSNPVQMLSSVQAGPSNPVMVSNVQAGPRNPVQNPSNVQAGPSNPVQMPSNIQAGHINPAQGSSNIQAGPSNPDQKPSNVQAGPSNSDQKPSNVQAGPSNPIQMPSNIQAGHVNAVQGPSNVQAGPSNPDQKPSNVQAGPSNSDQKPSNVQAGLSNPIQMPSNIQAGHVNPVQGPSNVQAGPSNPVQNTSNSQPIPNYEMYRNKYKKPFQYDSAYKSNHIEPQGDGYVDLFRGFHAGVYPMYTRENKSVTPHFSNPKRIWYQGIGFDMHMMRRNSSDKENKQFKDEANKTIQKINSEYPVENRKRRRFREK